MKGLAGSGAIAWLPSGDELVVGDQRVSLDGSPPRPFRLPGRRPTVALDGPMMDPVSVRGAKLAFSTPECRSQLLRVPLAGGPKTPLAPFFPSTRGEGDPAFAPDGRRVAFASWRSGEGRIWIGDADGSACHDAPASPGVDGIAGSPSWSPDGRRLAFDAGVGGVHVYIATPEGGTLRRLTSERTVEARPRWSRDGRFIYFASTRGGGWQLWKARADADGCGRRARPGHPDGRDGGGGIARRTIRLLRQARSRRASSACPWTRRRPREEQGPRLRRARDSGA